MPDTLRIIYDDTIFNLQKYGGISRYFSEVIRRIKENASIDVSVFRGFKGKLSRLNYILSDYKINEDKYDIYHPTYYSYAVKKRKHIKTVVTVYDMIHELYLFKMRNLRNDILVKKKSIINADHIICISHNTKKDLQKIYNIDEKIISVIYLGVNVKMRDVNEKYNLSNKPYILYVGKRGLYKNFTTLLNAFYLLKIKADFDLVCLGGGGFSKEEAREFRRLKLEDSIRHAEGPDDLLQSYYENARVFVYPSLYEGFGLPALEAMAFGCPVIAARTSSIPEITDNAALLFSPQSVEELCDRLQAVINDSGVRNDYIKKGKERYKNFSWEKTAQETLSVYRNLLA